LNAKAVTRQVFPKRVSKLFKNVPFGFIDFPVRLACTGECLTGKSMKGALSGTVIASLQHSTPPIHSSTLARFLRDFHEVCLHNPGQCLWNVEMIAPERNL
jgi:hypothetical protein